jgi:glycosyltransferase involved in cell wall biosynthesis
MRVCSVPAISAIKAEWAAGRGGGPVHHQVSKAKYLERLGWKTVERPEDADLVHGHGVLPPAHYDVLTIHAVWPVDRLTNPPEWWTEHNTRMASAAKRAERVVALSEFTANKVRELADVDVTVVPQAIDAEEWDGCSRHQGESWREQYGVQSERPVVLWGKCVIDHFLRDPKPARELAHLCPSATVWVTGHPYDYNWLSMPLNLNWLGALPFSEMRRAVSACDVYLATTLESSGQGHLEAMYCGKPVLGFNWGGVAETVHNGFDGVLVEPGDYEGLAKGLETILSNYEKMSKAARIRALCYTWEASAPKLVRIYEEVLGK